MNNESHDRILSDIAISVGYNMASQDLIFSGSAENEDEVSSRRLMILDAVRAEATRAYLEGTDPRDLEASSMRGMGVIARLVAEGVLVHAKRDVEVKHVKVTEENMPDFLSLLSKLTTKSEDEDES